MQNHIFHCQMVKLVKTLLLLVQKLVDQANDTRRKDIVFLVKGPTERLDDTSTSAEANYFVTPECQINDPPPPPPRLLIYEFFPNPPNPY